MTDDNDQTPPGNGIASYTQRLKTLSGPAGGLSISPRGNSFADGLPMPGGYAGRSTGGQNDLTARLDAATKQAETSWPASNSQIIASRGITVRPGSAGKSGDGWASTIAAQGVIPRPGTQAPASAANPMLSTISQGITVRPDQRQDPLASYSRANAVRQEMIDAQAGGPARIIADPADRNNAILDKMRSDRRISDAIDAAKYGRTRSQRAAASSVASSLINADTQQAVEASRQQTAQAGLSIQRRGQNLSHGAQMAQMGLTAQRLGMEQAEHAGRMEDAGFARQARQGLTITANSTDQEAKNAARMQAIAAGVLKPEARARLQTVQTDSGFMVFDPTTGRMTPAVGLGGQPVGSGKPLTEGQSKAVGYGTRAAESSRIIDEIGQGGKVQPSLIKRAAESIPLVGEGLGMAANQLASPEQQQVEQAQRDFVNAVLRQESGAAISQSEFDNARRQYFPQPGDSQEVVAQKLKNRETAIDGFRVAAGSGAKHIAPRQQQEQAPQQPAAPAPASALDFLQKNPQHAAAFKAKYGYLPEGY